MEQLALTISNSVINAPASVPQGGLKYMEEVLRNILIVFLFFGVSFVVIYISWGGLQWILAGGDKQKLTAAKAKVTWAIIGFIILMLSYAIVSAVGFLFRVNLLRLAFFN